ncbi:MAG: ABC transporter permease [Acidobacteriota bacterium]
MLRPALQLFRHRSLLGTLTVRDLKARYRGSLLGFFWSLVNPLLLLAVYSFVFGYVFRRPLGSSIEPYALFLVTGLFPWIWASGSMLEGTLSLASNSGLLRKAVFPIEILPMVSVFANLAHFLFALPILLGALAVGVAMGYPIGGWSMLLAPLVILLQIPMVAGLALALASLNVHFKDVRDLLSNLLTLLFFLAPILYPLEAVTIRPLAWVVWANPFSPFTLAYQQTLFAGTVPGWSLWLHMAVISWLCWVVGAWIFDRLRNTLVEAV